VIQSPPEEIYPRGFTHRIAALLLALPLIAGVIVFRGLLGPFWARTAVGTILLALVLFWWWEAIHSVAIHREGVVLRSGSRRREVLWDSIREIRYRATGIQAGGALGHFFGLLLARLIEWIAGRSGKTSVVDEKTISIRCVLRGDGTPLLTITSATRGAGEAVRKILERVNPRLTKEFLEHVRSSGTVEFGPLALTSDTIGRGGRILRFAEIASCGLASGDFFVKKQGAWLNAIRVPAGRIPNVFVLLNLLRQLGAPGLTGTDLASATSRR